MGRKQKISKETPHEKVKSSPVPALAATVDGLLAPDAAKTLRRGIGQLYRMGATLRSENTFRYLSTSLNLGPQVTTEQIWGQLQLLHAPVMQTLSAQLSRIEGEVAPKKKITMSSDEDEDEDEEDEEQTDDDGSASGSDDEADSDASSAASESSNGLGDDPHLAALVGERRAKARRGKASGDDAGRTDKAALLALAAEDEDDDWADEFETRDDDDAKAPRAQGEDDGLFDDEEGEEGEEGDDVMAELYGDDFGDDDNGALIGENDEEDEEDEEDGGEEEEEDEGDLYEDDEERFRRGMFPDRAGNDDILNDEDGAFGANGGQQAADWRNDPALEGMTDFQRRQYMEKRLVKDLEERRALDADWAMKGEVEAKARPKDSLLDEALDFEHGMKAVPIITDASTMKLEDRIKKRILENQFDDVVRKVAHTTAGDLTTTKRDTAAESEKSKASLMDLYEREYLAKLKRMEDAAGLNENVVEPLTEIEKDELKAIQMWNRLAQHLDALSNYFFTPKPVQEDLNVRVRAVDRAAPAITMEAVGTFAINSAAAVAPQDTFRPARKSMLGNVSAEEMTPRERQALRRAKKEVSAATKERIDRQKAEHLAKKKRRAEQTA